MDFVIIGNSWGASRSNPTSKHQVALSLAAKGHKVLWVDGAGMRKPSLSSGGDRSKIAAKLRAARAPVAGIAPGLWRVSPLILPLPSSGTARAVNDFLYVRAIQRGMRAGGISHPVLINFLPTIPGVVKAWSGGKRLENRGQRAEARGQMLENSERPESERDNLSSKIQPLSSIYYCVDRWDQFETYDSALMERLDAECCRNADIVIASAQDLYERCKRHNTNTHLIPHGVDHAHFASVAGKGDVSHRDHGEAQRVAAENASDLRSQNSEFPKHIGFFGLISEWVDQEILLELAEIENCEVVLAGKADVDAASLQGKDNINLMGPVPYADLPDLIASFDVGIIPFKVNELTRAVNPIKLREMLAAGCPVVSTDLPEVRKLAEQLPDGAVSVANDSEEFLELVKTQLDRSLPASDRKAISDSVKDQDWTSKVDQLISLINSQRIDARG